MDTPYPPREGVAGIMTRAHTSYHAPGDETEAGEGARVLRLRTRLGGTALLVGTGHTPLRALAPDAAEEERTLAARVIAREKPSTVVLALDTAQYAWASARRDAAAGKHPPAGAAPSSSPPVLVSHLASAAPGRAQLWPVYALDLVNAAALAPLRAMLPGPDVVQVGCGAREALAAEAAAPRGALVVLGDRPVSITLARLWQQLTPGVLAARLVPVLGAGWLLHPAYQPPLALLAPVAWAGARADWPALEAGLRALSADCAAAAGSRGGSSDWCPGAEAFNARVADCLLRGGSSLSAQERTELEEAYLESYGALDPALLAAAGPPALGAERDFLLALACYNAPGEVVVGVVERRHLAGMAKVWGELQASAAAVAETAAAAGGAEGRDEGPMEDWGWVENDVEEEEEGEGGEEEEEEELEGRGRRQQQQRRRWRAAGEGPRDQFSNPAPLSRLLSQQQMRHYSTLMGLSSREDRGAVARVTSLAAGVLPGFSVVFTLVRAYNGARWARRLLLGTAVGAHALYLASSVCSQAAFNVCQRVRPAPAPARGKAQQH